MGATRHGSNPLAGGEAVHDRHHHVQQHDIREGRFGEQIQRLLAIVGLCDIHVRLLQSSDEQVARHDVVIDDQHLNAASVLMCSHYRNTVMATAPAA